MTKRSSNRALQRTASYLSVLRVPTENDKTKAPTPISPAVYCMLSLPAGTRRGTISSSGQERSADRRRARTRLAICHYFLRRVLSPDRRPAGGHSGDARPNRRPDSRLFARARGTIILPVVLRRSHRSPPPPDSAESTTDQLVPPWPAGLNPSEPIVLRRPRRRRPARARRHLGSRARWHVRFRRGLARPARLLRLRFAPPAAAGCCRLACGVWTSRHCMRGERATNGREGELIRRDAREREIGGVACRRDDTGGVNIVKRRLVGM